MTKKQAGAAVAAPESPYLAARREWNERYGSHISEAKAWRAFALGSMGATVLAVGALGWVATQTKVVPYVVQVDKLATVLPVQRADQAARADASIVRASIGNWITDVRTVSVDALAQRRNILASYAMLQQGEQGWQVVTDIMRDENPFKRAQSETVSVAIQSVLPVGGDSWRVEWVETVRGRNGQVVKAEQWSAVVAVRITPPTDEAKILVNPLGVFIKTVSWSPRI